jgi:uncharacterized protein (DUF433 family)
MSVVHRDTDTIEPGESGGKPRTRGLRITASDALSYLAAGVSHQELLEKFPYLTDEHILACLACAAERERQTLVARKS